MTARVRSIGWVLAITLAAGLLMALAMPRGPGVSRDSARYFQYAQILRGQAPVKDDNGVAVALTHYPPGYPVMLASLNKLGLSYLQSARLIDAVCFGLTCGLASAVLLWGGRGFGRAAAAGLLMLTQPAVTFIHLWAVSEPPFLLLTVVLFGLLLAYRSQSRFGLLIAVGIGVTLAAACQVRYVGIAYLPAACWLVWRTPGRRWSFWHALAVAAVTVGPIVVMAKIQQSMAGEVAHREVGFEMLNAGHLEDFLTTLRGWLVSPDLLGVWAAGKYWKYYLFNVSSVLAAVVGLLLLATVGVSARRSDFGRIALTVGGVYFGLLVCSMVYVDHGTPFDDRILAPLAVLAVLWLAADFPNPATLGRPAAGVAVAVATIVASNGVARTAVQGVISRHFGYGANSAKFATSELLAAVRALPPAANIYSNAPEIIQIHGGHMAYILPGKGVQNGKIDVDEVSVVKNRLMRSGYVVFFTYKVNTKLPGKPMNIDELNAAYPLRKVLTTPDGLLLQWKGEKPPPKVAATQKKKKKSGV